MSISAPLSLIKYFESPAGTTGVITEILFFVGGGGGVGQLKLILIFFPVELEEAHYLLYIGQ